MAVARNNSEREGRMNLHFAKAAVREIDVLPGHERNGLRDRSGLRAFGRFGRRGAGYGNHGSDGSVVYRSSSTVDVIGLDGVEAEERISDEERKNSTDRSHGDGFENSIQVCNPFFIHGPVA